MNSFDMVCDMSEKSYFYVLMQGECLIIQSQKQYEEMEQLSKQINEALLKEKQIEERKLQIRQHMKAINGGMEID